MFDTNIFNSILDNKVDLISLDGKACFITHIQHDEIQATSNLTRRTQLEGVFTQISQQQIPTESVVFDVSRFGKAKWGDGIFYDKLLERLNKLNKRKKNNPQDVLIAETAIKNELVLVTHDKDLYLATTDLGGAACNLNCVLKL